MITLPCLVELINISKHFDSCAPVLQKVNLTLAHNESLSIQGVSGVGKSTLLYILGLLESPSAGLYRLNGQDVQSYSPKQRAIIRNRTLGFVFQTHILIPHLTVQENCVIGLYYRGVSLREARKQAQAWLKRFELDTLIQRYPAELSGGQQQRVCIVRAVMLEPEIVLADEPTSALDSTTKNEIVDLLFALKEALGFTLVMVTHDNIVANRCDRALVLDGAT